MAVQKYLTFLNFNRKSLLFHAVWLNIILSVSSGGCDKTFRNVPLYSNLKPVDSPFKDEQVMLRMDCATLCYNEGACKGFFFNQDEEWCSLYNRTFHSLAFVNHTGNQAYAANTETQADCLEGFINGGETSAVFNIQPRDDGPSFDAYCEMGPTDGGWLVIQRRMDGSEEFYRLWNEYKAGFGDLNREFWLGNTHIHRITSQGNYDLRIDLEDFEGNSVYALYKDFSLSSEEDSFRLSVGEYSGTAGDGLKVHNGQRFSAKDLDLDVYSDNCAVLFKGAWWYTKCHTSNLNGRYGIQNSYADGVKWPPWKGNYYSLKTSVMKIKPSPLME